MGLLTYFETGPHVVFKFVCQLIAKVEAAGSILRLDRIYFADVVWQQGIGREAAADQTGKRDLLCEKFVLVAVSSQFSTPAIAQL